MEGTAFTFDRGTAAAAAGGPVSEDTPDLVQRAGDDRTVRSGATPIGILARVSQTPSPLRPSDLKGAPAAAAAGGSGSAEAPLPGPGSASELQLLRSEVRELRGMLQLLLHQHKPHGGR